MASYVSIKEYMRNVLKDRQIGITSVEQFKDLAPVLTVMPYNSTFQLLVLDKSFKETTKVFAYS